MPPLVKNYQFSEKLGSGSYGEVYKAFKKSGAREVCAIKCVQKNKITKHEADAIVAEISILKSLKHDFIVQMLDFQWDSNNIYIIMEYCGGGDLSKYIKKHLKLPEKICQRFLQQLGAALKFLRAKNIAHMDLKPQNILITSNHPHIAGPVLKLADFGFAQYFNSDETKSALRGSPLYMAPEMVLDRRYDAKVDLWSVGVILYECLFGKAPYKSESLDDLLTKIKSEQPILIPRGSKLSEPCRDLLEKCLQRDPAKRIEYEDFFQHSFLDLEHMPSEESHAKALSLIDQAVKLDNENDLEAALTIYKSALEYLIPLITNEKNPGKKLNLRKKADQYILRAEMIKKQLGYTNLEGGGSTLQTQQSALGSLLISGSVSVGETSTTTRSSEILRSQQSTSRLDDLLLMSKNTPSLHTALEIGQSAEHYDLEGQNDVAFDKYQTALGLLIPLLSKEPKSERKTLLTLEVKRWMTRAETLKDLKNLQDKAMSDTISFGENTLLDKQCSIQ